MSGRAKDADERDPGEWWPVPAIVIDPAIGGGWFLTNSQGQLAETKGGDRVWLQEKAPADDAARLLTRASYRLP